MKSKFFFFASIILFLLLGGAVGFGWWYNQNFLKIQTEKVDELNSNYEDEFKAFEEKYNVLVNEKDKLANDYEKVKADLDVYKKNLDEAEKTIHDYNDRIEADRKAEEERIKSLSAEELAAEKSIKEYNEMVTALKASNAEYASLYNEVASFLQKEELTDAERKDFLEKYEKMTEIQKKFKDDKSADVSGNDVSGNDVSGNNGDVSGNTTEDVSNNA